MNYFDTIRKYLTYFVKWKSVMEMYFIQNPLAFMFTVVFLLCITRL